VPMKFDSIYREFEELKLKTHFGTGSPLFIYQNRPFYEGMMVHLHSDSDILLGHTVLHLMYSRKPRIRDQIYKLHMIFLQEMKKRDIEHVPYDKLDNI
jgi:hypothetical protein